MMMQWLRNTLAVAVGVYVGFYAVHLTELYVTGSGIVSTALLALR